MSPHGYKKMDLESQDLIFNANLGQDENLIWTKKLRCSHSIKLEVSANVVMIENLLNLLSRPSKPLVLSTFLAWSCTLESPVLYWL